MEPISGNALTMLDGAALVCQFECRACDLQMTGGIGRRLDASSRIAWLQRSMATFRLKTSAILLAALPQFEGNPTLQSLTLSLVLLTPGSALHFLRSSISNVSHRFLRGLSDFVNPAQSQHVYVRGTETQTS